jgi:hypothetical protein
MLRRLHLFFTTARVRQGYAKTSKKKTKCVLRLFFDTNDMQNQDKPTIYILPEVV